MSDTVAIEREAWDMFFDDLTEEQAGRLVTIEVLDGSRGDQIEVERRPFLASTYDPPEDVVVVTVDLTDQTPPSILRHLVNRPTEVDMTVVVPGRTSVRIVAADGSATLLHFIPPPALPRRHH